MLRIVERTRRLIVDDYILPLLETRGAIHLQRLASGANRTRKASAGFVEPVPRVDAAACTGRTAPD